MVQARWSAASGRVLHAGVAAMLAVASPALAAPFSYTTSGATYTQNFDTLPSTGSFSPSGSGPLDVDGAPVNATGTAGWQYWRYEGTGASALFQVNNGSGSSGATYSYGTTNATDRALGVLASGTGSYRIGMVLKNDTAATLTSFTLGYTGEQWRYGGSAAENRLAFGYSIGTGTAINSGGPFTAVSSLDFVRPVASGTAGALDGNLPANQRAITTTVGGLAWEAGQYLVIRWSDSNEAGNDDGLALDDLTFTARGSAAGANLYWSGASPWSATAPGAGGTGTWADGSGGWDATKTANFEGPSGTVTIAGTATAQAGVTFAANGYTLTGGTLALSASENLVAVNTGLTATVDSAISGSTGLLKAGLGTLVLGGTNSFTGGLTIGAGTVSVASDAALGGAGGGVAFNGGTLRTTAGVDLGSRGLTGAGSLDIAAGTTLATTGTVNLSGLALSNAGTLALNGASNTVGGITATITSGTARVAGNLDLGASKTLSVASGGTLQLAGNLAGTGITEKTGAGTLVLAGDNSLLARIRLGTQGATPVNGGTLVVSSATALGSDQVYFNFGTIQASEALTFANGLSIGGRASGVARLAGAPMTFGNTGAVALSGGTGDVRLDVDNDTTIAGDFTYASTTTGLTLGGAGTLRLTGFATGLTAPVTVGTAGSAVRLSVQGSTSVGSSLLTVASGGTLAGDGTVAALAVNSGGTLAPGLSPGTLKAGTTTLGAGGNYNFQVADATGTAGTGWDLLDVTGTLTVSATAADPFKVNLWSLSATNPDANGNAANFNNQNPYAWTIARATGGLSGFSSDKFTVNTSAVNGTGGFSNDLAGGSFSMAAAGNDLNVVFTPFVAGTSLDWYGNGSTQGGSGSWTTLGSNWSPDGGTTKGTWDSARTAVFKATSGTVTVQAGGISAARGLDFQADGYTLAGGTVSLTGASAAANAVTVASGAAATISAPLAGTAGLTKAGPGTLVLSAANGYTGGTVVDGGTLRVGNGTSGSIGGDVAVGTGARLAFNPGSAQTFSGAISGSGVVAKEGTASLVLSGSSSHSGGTTLEGGTLTAGSSSALGTGGVTALDGGLYAAAGASVANAITVGTAPSGGSSVLIAGWDFQTTATGGTAVTASPNTPTSFTANFGTGTLALDGTNGSSAWTAAQLSGFSGTAVNAGPGFSTSTTSPAALALVGSSANGQQAVFAVNMTGYSLLDLSYATRYSFSAGPPSSTGFTSQQWDVSTDGTTWQRVGTQSVSSETFSTKQLPTISALAGDATAYVRLTVSGATSSSGNNRLDNIQFLATPGSAPAGSVTLGTEATSGTATFSGNVLLNRNVTLVAPAGGRADFNGAISDAFGQNAVTKTGGGTVGLGGASTYVGPTTVAAGTLALSGTIAASPLVHVAGGATFDVTAKAGGYAVPSGQTVAGAGTVAGAIVVGTAATVSPGASPGTLTVTSNATLGPGGNYNWQILDATGTAGATTGWDLLSVGGGLDIAATSADPFKINLWSLSSTGPDSSGAALNFSATTGSTWRIASAAGGITGFAADKFTINTAAANGTGGFSNTLSGGSFSLAVAGNDLNLVFTPAPPTTDIVIDVPSGSQTQAQAGYPAIATATSVTKTGAGTVVFDAANTYTGPTTVSGGTLQVANDGALAASAVTVGGGATLAVASGTTMKAPSVTVDGGTLSGGTVSVNSATGVGTLTINSGTIASTTALVVGPGGLVDLPDAARVAVGVASLSVAQAAGGGKLDLGGGQVTIAAGGITQADLLADIVAGLGDGSWNGATGITSGLAASSGGTRAVGYTVDGGGAARVSFAAPGDTDLSGQVDIFDLLNMLGSGTYDTGLPAVWASGDFNYDGVSNIFDLLAILGSGTYDGPNYFPVAPSGFTPTGGLAGVAVVPEPGTNGMVLAAAAIVVLGMFRLDRLRHRVRPATERDRRAY